MQDEPAVIMSLIQAVIVLFIAFGAPITADEKVAIIGAASALMAVIFGFIVRNNVTPVSKILSRRN